MLKVTTETRSDLIDSMFDNKNKPSVFPEGMFAKSCEELPIGKVVVIQISPASYNQNAKDILMKLGWETNSNICIWGRIFSHYKDQSVSVIDQFGGLRHRNPSEVSIIRGIHEGYLFPKEEPTAEFFDLSFKEKYPDV